MSEPVLTLLHLEWPKLYSESFLTLLHSEWPTFYSECFLKLYRVLAILSAIGLKGMSAFKSRNLLRQGGFFLTHSPSSPLQRKKKEKIMPSEPFECSTALLPPPPNQKKKKKKKKRKVMQLNLGMQYCIVNQSVSILGQIR